jgi:hexosaminidase
MKPLLPIIPYPSQEVRRLPGLFLLSDPLAVSVSSNWSGQEADAFLSLVGELLSVRTVRVPAEGNRAAIRIGRRMSPMNDEGYALDVGTEGISIEAMGSSGVLYGLQSLRQLKTAYADGVPCCHVVDEPMLPWRGFMLDVARTFCPFDDLLRIVDILSGLKLNMLHLHLSDDQGWRFPVDGYPALVEGRGHDWYTKQQLRDLVSYAARRHVSIVPEIDMPGHVLSALVEYPRFSCSGGPFSLPTGEGIFSDILCIGNDDAIAFAKTVVAEVCEVFPAPFIHLGGDEIPLQAWRSCPKCQRRKLSLGLADERALLRWFCNEIARYARQFGKQVILWSDYIDGGYVPYILPQVWNPLVGRGKEDRLPHPAIYSEYFHTYLDMGHDLVPLRNVYGYGKMLRSMAHANGDDAVVGAELLLWTEYVTTREDRDLHMFPRLLAGAEAFWTDSRRADYRRFLRIVEQYAASYFPDISIVLRTQWDPPLPIRLVSRWKRWRRVKRNSTQAGIVL